MKTKHDIVQLLSAIRAELEARGIEHADLFGSYARGEQRPDSDVDLALTISNSEFPRGEVYFGRRSELEELLTQHLGQKVHIADLSVMREPVKLSYEEEFIRVF